MRLCLIKLAQEETKNGELPEYEGDVDMSGYDIVFIGGHVWWGTYPQVMFTFFKKHVNDLKGKTVIPFTTHEGSGLANCVEDVKDAFPGAKVQHKLQHLWSRSAYGEGESGDEVFD